MHDSKEHIVERDWNQPNCLQLLITAAISSNTCVRNLTNAPQSIGKKMARSLTDDLNPITTEKHIPSVVQEVFTAMVMHIESTGWGGACHSSSAIMHMLLKEKGVDSTIKIGEVGGGGYWFDHSWIEIDNLVFDAAVAYPQVGGKRLGGPVFAGIDIVSGIETTLTYGIGKKGGLEEEAQQIALLSLGAYFQFADQHALVEAMGNGEQPPPALWDRASYIGTDCGVHRSPAELAREYFEVRRAETYA
ncbi:hypothetical protein [Pseudomonas sp. P108]|uniref:hypothetical protein n=1 Tax=Pseudomonas sp. P108 TaxID=1837993 RepID=UPI00293425F7|nr:hypothetical protein [Pseudomonas sp. P108]WNZ87438.1 hypothetical protein QOM10_29585 [Pseudomonas sp. P108]